jgi:hypothetical protein
MITLERLKTLKRGDVVVIPPNGEFTRPARWRVNGKVQTWKRSPERVRVPVKFGLYSYDAITEDTLTFLSVVGAYIEGEDA